MKFCRPVFRMLKDVDLALARSTWEKNSSSFRPIARKMIEKVCLVCDRGGALIVDEHRHCRIWASLRERSLERHVPYSNLSNSKSWGPRHGPTVTWNDFGASCDVVMNRVGLVCPVAQCLLPGAEKPDVLGER